MYIESFEFPDDSKEFDFIVKVQRQCYNTMYPFKVLSQIELESLEFEPITILYGSNGCGKTTVLNIIAEKLKLKRESMFNKSNFFQDYVKLCKIDDYIRIPEDSKIITSDDVFFDYMINVRTLNEGIDYKREELFSEYLEVKHSNFKMKNLDDYDHLKKVNLSRRKTQTQYIKNQLIDNIRELSNGESAFKYFTEHIKENCLYLLDEPENSLSPERQMELIQFIEDSVRFYNCQFIISSHSPFILSMKGAKIYNLDEIPVRQRAWTELKNIRTYYDFFKHHEGAFE